MGGIKEMFDRAVDSIGKEYQSRRKMMSFSEYMADFAKEPRLNLRDASRYLLDAIDYFGSTRVERPWGTEIRYKIFDQEFNESEDRLVGQEQSQMGIRSAIASQVRDGRVNRLIVIHGPNGSAKSTMVRCLFKGLEHYSRLDQGNMYRFRWIFPTRKTSHGTIGFGARLNRDSLESFAHLADDQIEATLDCEVRDHPLLLLPKEERRRIMKIALENAGEKEYQIPDHFLDASLCHRCRQVADALMRTHLGDIRKVLAHVQIEPWALSRRYRRGLAQVGPQLSTDAAQRQVTADRNLGALPIELQNMTLFETFGALVDASGGIVEFDDMLKRPLDTFKYLLGSIETGEVMLGQSILKLNTVLLATTNDDMLEAFRQHHEFTSFRDRLTLVPAPYLTMYSEERHIYELQLVPNIGRHVAPHSVFTAAFWAVLTRLHKPAADRYQNEIRNAVSSLTVTEKADLYERGAVPERLNKDEAAVFKEVVRFMRNEDSSKWSYEGRYGASPRLIRQVLLESALSEEFECLSPFAVLKELDDLCGRVREHPFLDRESEDGGYHDHRGFVKMVEDRVLDAIEEDIRIAAGLIEESKYEELMVHYVSHVRHLVEKEKIYNESTGAYEDPDEAMMDSVEKKIGIDENAADFRRGVIARIAAWAIENPKKKLPVGEVFPKYLKRLRGAYFEENRQKVAKIAQDALSVLSGEGDRLTDEKKTTAESLITRMENERGYCRSCAREALAHVLSKRFEAEK